MKPFINNPAFLQEACNVRNNASLFYIKSEQDENEISFENCKLGVFADKVQYSTDGGATWEQLTSETIITLNAGDIAYFRNPTRSEYDGAMSNKVVTTTSQYSVGGNISGLFYPRELPRYAFKEAFLDDENLVGANKLILKHGLLAESCYSDMFSGCTGLTTAPELPATSLAESCYSDMFSGCTGLTTIDCYATSYAIGATSNWVNGVAEIGTFSKASDADFWETGVNGIPSGWSVVDK